MLTHKDAKTMAKSLRDALENRNVQLSHSDCLEIVARQFGSADWNTLSAKFSREEARQSSEPVPQASSAPTAQTPAPWSTCSFCGKSPPDVRIVLGGCGGWEGFFARRNPESGERSNVFICNECIKLCARIVSGTVELPQDAEAIQGSSA